MNCEAGLVNRMKYRWVGILLHSDLKGEKVLGLACKQVGLSAELVQSRVLCIFLISPVCGFLEVPPFTHCLVAAISKSKWHPDQSVQCWAHTKVVSRWACQKLRSPDPVSPWKGTVFFSGGPSLYLPALLSGQSGWLPWLGAILHLPLTCGSSGGRGSGETSLALGALPAQLAAPSARLPPGVFEQLEHPTALQSGWGSWDSHLILCSSFKNTSVALLSCLWINAMRQELNCPNLALDSKSRLLFLISSTAKLFVKN